MFNVSFNCQKEDLFLIQTKFNSSIFLYIHTSTSNTQFKRKKDAPKLLQTQNKKGKLFTNLSIHYLNKNSLKKA